MLKKQRKKSLAHTAVKCIVRVVASAQHEAETEPRKSIRTGVAQFQQAAKPLANSDVETNATVRTKSQKVHSPPALASAVFDKVDVNYLYRHTVITLKHYQRRVNEGLDLEAANTFCAFVFNSGLEKFLAQNAFQCEWIEGALVKMRTDLQWQIREMWRTCKVTKTYDEGAIEALTRKVDALAVAIAKPAKVLPSEPPQLGQGDHK